MIITVEQFVKDGIPTLIRCYDNQGKSYDRYTVVFTELEDCPYLSMSDNPLHPQGVCISGTSSKGPIDRPTHSHLGKKVSFQNLPEEVRKYILKTYREIWQLEEKI